MASRHRPIGYFTSERHAVDVQPFHNRDELNEARAALIAQEAIDLQRLIDVGVIQCGERVPFHAVLLEER